MRWTFSLDIGDRLEACLRDSGEEYDGDLSAVMPGELAESGRGFALAEAALDELRYHREDSCNVWTMVRLLSPA